jgi:methylmalonyl-CoA mutase
VTVESERLPLAAEFPQPDREQWQRLVEGVLAKSGKPGLAGEAAEDALSTGLQGGLRVRPLYTAQDLSPDPGLPGFAPFVRGGRAQGSAVAGWDVRQLHQRPQARASNEAVLADLENGVTSLWLVVGGENLPVEALPEVLEGVYLDLAGVVLDAGADVAAAAEQLFALYAERAVPDGAVSGCLGADPLGVLARTGRDDGTAQLSTQAAALASRCAHRHPDMRTLMVDALVYHDAGASAAEELGCSLATAVAYLRELVAAGLSVDEAAGQLEFRYAADTDQFLTIAKLRAARRLWSRVAQVCGVTRPGAAAQRQHAVTSAAMMTERDPWVNMLRTTVACLAAGVGGADAVTVLPFDAAIGLPDDFSRRIARNTQAILVEESHLARVIDPVGGSWYAEALTDDLARAAWAWFQEIERSGGQRAALRSGLIGERLAQTSAERSAQVARRREPIVGVSEFPNLAEQPVVRDPAPAREGGGGGEAGGLPRIRRAAPFERLRTRSDAQLAAIGRRPRLVLAAIGPAAGYTARSSFAANLFQAGGLETVLVEVGGDPKALADAFAANDARAACLCSSDALYAEHAESVAAALKSAGAGRVLLAGRPGERREAYEAAGIDSFVYVGCDAVALLAGLLDEIGVAP